MPPLGEEEFSKALATAMDRVNPLMGLPIAVRNNFLSNGFSQEIAEQAALAMWTSMMGLGNNASSDN